MKTKRIKERKKINKVNLITMIVIIVLIVSYLTSSFGRYALNFVNDFYLRSKEFYFYSNKLLATGKTVTINDWPGTDSYNISVEMNSRENNILVSRSDITYNIACTNISDDIIVELSKTSGTIHGSDSEEEVKNVDSFEVTVTPQRALEDGDAVSFTIETTSTSPYIKTLSAVYTLVVGKAQLTYRVIDEPNQPYFDVNITNAMESYKVGTAFGNHAVGDELTTQQYAALTDAQKALCYSARVSINFNPSTCVMDITDSHYIEAASNNRTTTTTIIKNGNTYTYVNGLTFDVNPLSSTTVRFYKNDVTQDYTYSSNESTGPCVVTLTSL